MTLRPSIVTRSSNFTFLSAMSELSVCDLFQLSEGFFLCFRNLFGFR